MASSPNRQLLLHDRLTVRLTGAVIAALLLIGTPFLVAFHKLQRDRQIEGLEEVTARVGGTVVDALRSAMMAGTPHLLDDVVRRLSDQEGIERALLLDHRGHLRVSSESAGGWPLVDRDRDPTCAGCHRGGKEADLQHSSVLQVDDRRVLRSVTSIPNEPRCHGCHDPAVPVNGLLVLDMTLADADRRFLADIGGTLALGALMVFLTVVVMVWLLRRLVHRPLQAVVDTSRRIAEGDLDARAPERGTGEFAELAAQLNLTTTRLARFIRTVENQRRDLEAILDAVDDQIVVVDRSGRVMAANAAFRADAAGPGAGPMEENAPAGSSPARDAIGKRAAPETPPADEIVALDEPVRIVFATGELHKSVSTRTQPDGRDRVLEVHASPVRDVAGTVTRCVEVRRDISERRHLEAIAAQSERLASLGLLASGLSHEINNPLQAIASSVEGLCRRLRRDPDVSPEAAERLEKVLARIGREVERGRIITHRLLKIARPPGRARSVSDLNQVVRDVVGLLAHDMQRSGISSCLELGRELPPLRVDEARLGQVVMNLALNAIQAMGEGSGRLHIATSVRNGSIRMEVADTGCGIRPDHMKSIFEPFFTTKPVGKGTGLGLFITHQIVTGLGGSVAANSRPGEGTRFTVDLPFRDVA